MQFARSDAAMTELMERASSQTEINFSLNRTAVLPTDTPPGGSGLEEQLRTAVREHVRAPFRMDAVGEPSEIVVQIRLPEGVLTAAVSRKRLTTSTTYIFILWMIGSSLVLFIVAAIFVRTQVKSLRRIAVAGGRFG